VALQDEVAHLKESNPGAYQKLVPNNGIISILIAGIDKGIPVAKGITIGLSPIDSPQITRLSCPGDCPIGIMTVGQADAIKHYIIISGPPQGPAENVPRILVQLEVNAGSAEVGGVVDVLRFLLTGAVLGNRKQNCQVDEG
jgi:hypothetical protein